MRDSLRKNLDFFQSMNGEQILNHRKNKFLSVGRSRGFMKEVPSDFSLNMKDNYLSFSKMKIIKNYKFFLAILAISSLVILAVDLNDLQSTMNSCAFNPLLPRYRML